MNLIEEHPPIVLNEQSKADKSTAPAAISKLSQNVSKAADSAKQRLSAMFNRKSSADLCPACEGCLAVSSMSTTTSSTTKLYVFIVFVSSCS